MLRRIALCVILFIILLANLSCYSNAQLKETMDSWLGASKHQLLLQWGSPTSVFPDGNGGEIYTYVKTSQTGGFAWTDYWGNTHWRAPQQVHDKYNFYINSSDRIYAWRVN